MCACGLHWGHTGKHAPKGVMSNKHTEEKGSMPMRLTIARDGVKEVYVSMTEHNQALTKAKEEGRLSVLQDFDSVTKADSFLGFTHDEWEAVRKFFAVNDKISGWKETLTPKKNEQ